jgi:hypothetical protein
MDLTSLVAPFLFANWFRSLSAASRAEHIADHADGGPGNLGGSV